MTSCTLRSILGVALLLAPNAAAQQLDGEALPVSGPRLFAATTDGGVVGALVELAGTTLPDVELLAPTDGARLLRRFGKQLFVVNRLTGTIRRVPMNGGASQVYDLGRDAMPMDVLVPGAQLVAAAAGTAWVTRRNDPDLLRLDLLAGVGTEAIDLSPVGGGAAIQLGTMARDGSRLFVQVRVSASGLAREQDTGVLAVVDLVQGALVDVDPAAPGIQGIALQGAPPRFKMQIVGNTLFVSTTESFYDVRGGIERVDLATLTSVGYAITEAGGQSDMGGFVMLDDDRGYYVFHTDLLASTHLVSFSVSGGPTPGSMIDLLGDTVDTLAYDPARQRLYLPSGFADNGPGLYVFSTVTDALVGPPLSTGLRPHDVLLEQAPLPFEPSR